MAHLREGKGLGRVREHRRDNDFARSGAYGGVDSSFLRFARAEAHQEAFDLLLPMAERSPEVWTIPYNLACYCAQLGRLVECKEWFQKAMAIDKPTVKRLAIDDPDLKPLWDSMGGIR